MEIFISVVFTGLFTGVIVAWFTARKVERFYFDQKDQLIKEAALQVGEEVEKAVLKAGSSVSEELEESVRRGVSLGVKDLTNSASNVTGEAIIQGIKGLEVFGNLVFNKPLTDKNKK